MSVLIKGLEMPTTCTMCWLNTFCGVWNTEPVKHKGFNERLENCPLTELIRCKDCKNNPSTLIGWIECPMTGAGTRKPNDFCSYAEPKVKK